MEDFPYAQHERASSVSSQLPTPCQSCFVRPPHPQVSKRPSGKLCLWAVIPTDSSRRQDVKPQATTLIPSSCCYLCGYKRYRSFHVNSYLELDRLHKLLALSYRSTTELRQTSEISLLLLLALCILCLLGCGGASQSLGILDPGILALLPTPGGGSGRGGRH